MTTVDWIIVGFVLLLASWGFRQGAVLGASSLVGFFLGATLGTRIAGKVLDAGSSSPYAPLFALAGAVAVGAVVAEISMALGFRLRSRFTSHTAKRVDGSIGAALLGALALGLVWVGAAAVMQSRTTPELRSELRHSSVIRQLNELLPPSGPVLNALARIDPFPQVDGPAARVPAPTGEILQDPDVVSASRSVVRILGNACGYGVEGSGWVVSPDVIVTNAHVVAGQTGTIVQPGGDGPNMPARAIWFDSRNDLALLYVPGSGLGPLTHATRSTDRSAVAILGYPENGPYDARAGRVATTKTVLSQDAYGRGPVSRAITSFRGLVRHGNSGGPLVDERGYVVGTVFASAVGDGKDTGYAVPNSILDAALLKARAAQTVSTGPCA